MKYKICLIIIFSVFSWNANASLTCNVNKNMGDTFDFQQLVIPNNAVVGQTLARITQPGRDNTPLVTAGILGCTLRFTSDMPVWNGDNQVFVSEQPGIGFKVETNRIFYSYPPTEIRLKSNESFTDESTTVYLIKIGDINPTSHHKLGSVDVQPKSGGGSFSAFHVNITNFGFVKTTCEVEPNSKGVNVSLGTFNTGTLQSAGGLSSPVPFSLVLNCPRSGPSVASVTFDGQKDPFDETLLALNPDPRVAKGLAVRINDEDGTKIPLSNPSATKSLVNGKLNELHFSAQYQIITGQNLKPGIANATASFTVNYN
ncbi:fimbrial protein [Vibrio campbellii]|uniref:Fimbrial protein n=1 Tax=Vibrio campbellii TaxID=680 RepID=A0ABY5IQT6_9VIBR|nr:fimbrial protein [Vibrio campbellii]UTZ25226.1 fimbrial protein [Vibrio campbellii]UTZ35156.1 fimbrial protein [Vibrio campbellii]UTZ35221.1 fimbrial protein [Vibrio campbellii]